MWELFLWCMLLGGFAGITAGLFGIGGGLIVVPALHYLLPLVNVPSDMIMPYALGTSLATIVITGFASAQKHARLDHVSWYVVKWFAPVLVPVAFVSSQLVSKLPQKQLTLIFAVIVTLLALRMFLSGAQKQHSTDKLTKKSIFAGSFVIAAVSSAAGIGGGSLSVPFLHSRGLTMREAIGTSAVCTAILAVSGAVSYAIVGWGNPDLMPYSLGYIYLPAVFAITGVSYFTSRIGAGLTEKLPVNILRRAFAILLCIVAINMFLK